MEAVDVLPRRDGVGDARLVHVRGERQLDEDPVHLVVGVELPDEREHLRLGRIRVEADVPGVDAGFCRGLVLQPDVDVRRGVVADEHGRQPDVTELLDLACHLAADPLRECPAVHERRRHARDSRRSVGAGRPGSKTEPNV